MKKKYQVQFIGFFLALVMIFYPITTVAAPARNDHGIKGILPASTDTEFFKGLGISQIAYNIELGTILKSGPSKGDYTYHYHGKDYYFNYKKLAEYDRFFKWCSENDFQITLTLLNATSSKGTHLIHPDALDGTVCPTYAINTKDQEGIDEFGAIIAFLAGRYTKGPYGTIDNWILGNQVNARTEWYYLGTSNLDTNVREYCKAFRIFYNEIKKINPSADICISLDQEWNKKSNPGCFLSREYLARFAYYIKQGGELDWSLAIHPYNAPLYDPYAWNQQSIYVTADQNTPYITMANIDVLISEMKKPIFLNKDKKVRHIHLSEVGYTSSFGEDLQAASIAYAYCTALKHPEIKSFILYRETDSETEIASNIAQGLKTLDGRKKLAYDYYATAGTRSFDRYRMQFKEITGLDIDTLVGKPLQTRDGWQLDDRLNPAHYSIENSE